MMEGWKEKLAILTAPIEHPRWRVQGYYPKDAPTYAVVVPYVDAREVQERFDLAFGAENWQNTYDPESGSSSISVKFENDWITKSDVGVETKVEKEKGKASDAFKRAAVLWGVGRDLYQIGEKVLPCTPKKVTLTSDKKTELRTPSALSNYLNAMSTSMGLLYQIWLLNKDKQADDEFKELFTRLKEYVK